MLAVYAISLLLLLAYLFVIIRYILAWERISGSSGVSDSTHQVSVILPCRNEGANINHCLQSLSHQNLNLERFEILVIDDHSTDDTVAVALDFFLRFPELNGKVIQLTEPLETGKKHAITRGIKEASHTLIATTDGDCLVPEGWLSEHLAIYAQSGAKMIAGPVTFQNQSGFLNRLQELEFSGLQLVAGAGIQLGEPVLCNGANLFYEKEAFLTVGGYQDNAAVASGDDLFLLQKIDRQFPGQLHYAKSKNALVTTNVAESAAAFFTQRKRWVSKVISVDDFSTIIIAFIVYLTNLSLLVNLGLWALLPDFNGSFLIITFGAKAIIDLLFLHLATSYFGRSNLMWYFLPAELLNTVYVSLIGLFGNVGKYEWKGRTSDPKSFVRNNS